MSRDQENVYRLGKLILLGMAVQLVVIFYVWYSNYQGRQDLVEVQRHACERAKLDRAANAEGWTIAKTARKDSGQFIVSARYSHIADGLEKRSRIDCSQVFPDAGVFP